MPLAVIRPPANIGGPLGGTHPGHLGHVRQFPWDMDLIVLKPRNLKWRLEQRESFLTEIMAKGKVLVRSPVPVFQQRPRHGFTRDMGSLSMQAWKTMAPLAEGPMQGIATNLLKAEDDFRAARVVAARRDGSLFFPLHLMASAVR